MGRGKGGGGSLKVVKKAKLAFKSESFRPGHHARVIKKQRGHTFTWVGFSRGIANPLKWIL